MKMKWLLLFGLMLVNKQVLAETEACPEGKIRGINTGNCIAASGTCGNDCRYTINEQGHLNIEGTGTINNALNGNRDFTSINIEPGITGISSLAFNNTLLDPSTGGPLGVNMYYAKHNELMNVVIPETVTSLPYNWGGWYSGYIPVYCTGAQISNEICNGKDVMRYEKENDDYIVYNKDGTICGIYGDYSSILDNKLVAEHYVRDENGNITGKYDSMRNLLSSYIYDQDGSVSIYDKNGKLVGVQGKRILTVDEATALANGDKNTFTIRYR